MLGGGRHATLKQCYLDAIFSGIIYRNFATKKGPCAHRKRAMFTLRICPQPSKVSSFGPDGLGVDGPVFADFNLRYRIFRRNTTILLINATEKENLGKNLIRHKLHESEMAVYE